MIKTKQVQLNYLFVQKTVQQQKPSAASGNELVDDLTATLSYGLTSLMKGASYIGRKVNENVIEPVRDPNFSYNVTTYVSSVGEKVSTSTQKVLPCVSLCGFVLNPKIGLQLCLVVDPAVAERGEAAAV